eukprot:364190-Chlamydomonas_euryale.AAC.2
MSSAPRRGCRCPSGAWLSTSSDTAGRRQAMSAVCLMAPRLAQQPRCARQYSRRNGALSSTGHHSKRDG